MFTPAALRREAPPDHRWVRPELILIVCRLIVINRLDYARMNLDLQKFGQRVRDRRQAIGLSQEELAERCGLHRTYIGGIERGERNVGVLNLLQLARALQVRPGELLADAR